MAMVLPVLAETVLLAVRPLIAVAVAVAVVMAAAAVVAAVSVPQHAVLAVVVHVSPFGDARCWMRL